MKTENQKLKILVTGASGFIGSFLCEEGLHRDMEVWAGMRKTSSRKWLQNEWLKFQVLDLSNPDTLRQQLSDFKQKNGKWDYIVHAGGATKCIDPADFDKHNYQCTVNFVQALQDLDMVPRLFVYLSSFSVLGPIKETLNPATNTYEEMYATDTPQPNTAYAKSKLRSERFLQSLNYLFPYVIFRPTGVYGPRERDYFLMAKSIKQHVDFAVGYKKQEITFVYVRDLVNAIYASIQKTEEGALERIERQIFNVSDGQVYSSRAFSDYIQQDLGIRFLLRIKAPVWLLHVICAIGDRISQWTKKPVTLNLDKYHILRQRNWRCDITPLRQLLDFEPEWQLERGTRETIDWYVKNKWL
ncbi:MAG: NAD(P)-dependent oxidoreductase [Bacteroidaceae bacterium]|nr:NAD(P)-dependent oxidoreductase [Bacteroidaceae bacterium]